MDPNETSTQTKKHFGRASKDANKRRNELSINGSASIGFLKFSDGSTGDRLLGAARNEPEKGWSRRELRFELAISKKKDPWEPGVFYLNLYCLYGKFVGI